MILIRKIEFEKIPGHRVEIMIHKISYAGAYKASCGSWLLTRKESENSSLEISDVTCPNCLKNPGETFINQCDMRQSRILSQNRKLGYVELGVPGTILTLNLKAEYFNQIKAGRCVLQKHADEIMILELTPEDCIHTEAIYEVCVNGGEAWDEIMEWMLDSDMFSFYKRNPDGVFKLR